MAADRDSALALIVAPAGYGKSTLLAEWAEHDDRPFVWVTLGERDTDHVRVARSILAGFEETGWIEPDAMSALTSSAEQESNHLLQPLMRSLSSLNHSFVLVLDGGQVVRPAALKEIIQLLLEELPRDSQVALASRAAPALPIGRLRAHRAVTEVRTRDLVMTPAQAGLLLRNAGLELDFTSVQALSQQTEGWPAALYLAALSLREQDEVVAGDPARFTGDDNLVSDYVHDEFLTALPAESAEFMVRTSVLDRLSGPLCDAILKQQGSGARLAGLARANLLLVPLDRAHEQYRWHGLLRDALRAQLRRTEPQLELRLQRRASAWHARHGDLDRAIDHAVAAGDADRTGDLLWPNILEYVTTGRSGMVERWLDGFSSEQIADYAPLALAAAYSSLTLGRIGQAHHWSLAAVDAERRGRVSKATDSLRTGMAVLEVTTGRTDAVGMGREAKRAYEREPHHSPWRPVCCLLSGTAEQLLGHRAAASQLLNEGLRLSASTLPSIAALCLAQLVIIAIEQEDWDTAAELADRAEASIEQPGLADYPTSAIVVAASSAVRAHHGRTDEAKRDLRRGADLLAALGDFIPWYGVQTRILLARAALGLADTVAARTLLAGASRLARRTPEVIVFQRSFDEAWSHIDTLAETALAGPSSLTIAELRILRFLPTHQSFREIAQRLDVSVNTVKTQAHAIYRKLDAASRSEAVARATDAGLLGA